MQLLADLFPQLWFARPADKFLQSGNPGSITEQLRSRHISEVRIIPFPRPDETLGYGGDGLFFVAIDDALSPMERPAKLGLEIGHTFHHNLTHKPPQNILSESERSEIERFCAEFAIRWVKRNGATEIAHCLENEAKIASASTHAIVEQ